MKSKHLNFIKLSFYLIVGCSSLLIQSCSNSEIEILSDQSSQSLELQNGVFRVYDKTYNTPNGLQIWEAQLNKTIEIDSNMVRNGLKLVSYEYVRQIASTKDLEVVKNELKKDNSSFITYEDNSSHFTISENNDYSKKYVNLIDSLLPTSEDILQTIASKGDTSLFAKATYIFKKNDLGVVNLVWEYKGKTLNTLCLVSNEKGIVFDKFLFSIRMIVSKNNSVSNTSSKSPQQANENGHSVKRNFHVGYKAYNAYGEVVAECWVDVNLFGYWYEGTNYVTEFNMNQYSMSICPPWNYATFVAPISFSPTTPTDIGHLQFAYGIIGGNNVSVEWNGYYATWQGDAYIIEGCPVTLVASEMN